MDKQKLRSEIEKYLRNNDLFFDFSSIHDLEKPFTGKEKARRKEVAKSFSHAFDGLDPKQKASAFKRKLTAVGISKPLNAFGDVGSLKNVSDYTNTTDFRVPRKHRICHQVICLVFEKKNIFVKASRSNQFETEYQQYAKQLGLPWIHTVSVQLGRDRQVILSEGINASNALTEAKTFSIKQLGMHAALADFLNKGGRNGENYLVSNGDVYAIDNEFLHNKKSVFREDLKKGYHELFALGCESLDLSSAIDALFEFVAGYRDATRKLKSSYLKLNKAISYYLLQLAAAKDLTKKDRDNLMRSLLIKNFVKDLPLLSRYIGNSSPVLRKALRQSTWITERLFEFIPIRSISNNFDSKTFVLREALIKEMVDKRSVLEIGPGCNATLSQFLKKNWPSAVIDTVELNTDFILNARRSIRANHLKIRVKKGDIVQGIKETYDLIFWNIPAVSSNKGVLTKTTNKLFKDLERFATESDDGTGLVKRFLHEAPARLKPGGILMFASNTVYVPAAKIQSLITSSGLRLLKTVTQRSNSSKAYVLAPK